MSVENVDVLIVGAGLSGIGAGNYLRMHHPGKRYVILEARDSIGGTWDLFRYPGIRSDSDMYTLGYSFRPWLERRAIADGPSILKYVRDAAREGGVEPHIRFNHRAARASWSSADAKWTIEATRKDGSTARFTASFLYLCSGYYDYAEGYTPPFPGLEKFKGRFVHPQKWTSDIQYAGKKVVVIGSGATAVTLVPEMAKDAAHVTMLQRSPTYIVSLPAEDRLATFLNKWLPARVAYFLTRWKNVLRVSLFYWLARQKPHIFKHLLKLGLRRERVKEEDIRAHFKPTYQPWDQRLCLVPDADLFKALNSGRASMVTDHIETFTEKGIRLKSGRELEADLVVSATGLNLLAMGGLQMSVDGRAIELAKTMSYKGMMLSDVPNAAFAVGYTNASWTLKCDLTSLYLCRLLAHMDRHGWRIATPRRTDPTLKELPAIDFSSGYVQRAIHSFPRQGDKKPWRLYQNYALDLMTLKFGPIDDGSMEFSKGGAPAAQPVGQPERRAA